MNVLDGNVNELGNEKGKVVDETSIDSYLSSGHLTIQTILLRLFFTNLQ